MRFSHFGIGIDGKYMYNKGRALNLMFTDVSKWIHIVETIGGETVNIELTQKEFRRLLDLVYIGNWVLNSTRGEDRLRDYDHVESKIFAQCHFNGMPTLFQISPQEGVIPSQEFVDGGIHEAIMDYEDAIFYDILAEELSRRDLGMGPNDPADNEELRERMEDYLAEFEQNGVNNISIDGDFQ